MAIRSRPTSSCKISRGVGKLEQGSRRSNDDCADDGGVGRGGETDGSGETPYAKGDGDCECEDECWCIPEGRGNKGVGKLEQGRFRSNDDCAEDGGVGSGGETSDADGSGETPYAKGDGDCECKDECWCVPEGRGNMPLVYFSSSSSSSRAPTLSNPKSAPVRSMNASPRQGSSKTSGTPAQSRHSFASRRSDSLSACKASSCCDARLRELRMYAIEDSRIAFFDGRRTPARMGNKEARSCTNALSQSFRRNSDMTHKEQIVPTLSFTGVVRCMTGSVA